MSQPITQQSQAANVPLCFITPLPDDCGNVCPENPRRGLLMLKGVRDRLTRATVAGEPERSELLDYATVVVSFWRSNAVRLQAMPDAPSQAGEIAKLDNVLGELCSLTPDNVLAWLQRDPSLA